MDKYNLFGIYMINQFLTIWDTISPFGSEFLSMTVYSEREMKYDISLRVIYVIR